MDSAKRVINGTWGEAWADGYKISEIYGAQAKVSHNREDVDICGQMMTDGKITSCKGNGSLSIYKVYSRFADYSESILKGIDTRITLILKLADPDAYGAERVVLKNVSLDESVLADWTAKQIGKLTIPFTFTDYEFLDKIAVG